MTSVREALACGLATFLPLGFAPRADARLKRAFWALRPVSGTLAAAKGGPDLGWSCLRLQGRRVSEVEDSDASPYHGDEGGRVVACADAAATLRRVPSGGNSSGSSCARCVRSARRLARRGRVWSAA